MCFNINSINIFPSDHWFTFILIGTMYRIGLGVNKDVKKSMEVFEIGVQRGDQTCKDILDIMKNPELFDIETGNMKGQ